MNNLNPLYVLQESKASKLLKLIDHIKPVGKLKKTGPKVLGKDISLLGIESSRRPPLESKRLRDLFDKVSKSRKNPIDPLDITRRRRPSGIKSLDGNSIWGQ